MAPSCRPARPRGRGKGFSPYFTHWRTGKRYYARDYGHKAWPIG